MMSGSTPTLPVAPPVTAPQSQPVQVYANRGGQQIFSLSVDATGAGKPMMSADLDDIIDGLRAVNALQAKMRKFVTALAAANDVDEATLAARLQG